MSQIRTIVEERQKNIAIMDVFSKLAQERIIFIDSVIESDLANGVIAQLLYLDSIDNKKPINIYINTPGGDILDSLAIYDVATRLKSPIRTTCVGKAASMGAVLMLMGEERVGLAHSRIMIHEAAGYLQGKTKDVAVQFGLQTELQEEVYDIIKSKTNITDMNIFKVDTWYNAPKALEIGFLTKIL
jgi:ATP-dependent Clp protease protease subunit